MIANKRPARRIAWGIAAALLGIAAIVVVVVAVLSSRSRHAGVPRVPPRLDAAPARRPSEAGAPRAAASREAGPPIKKQPRPGTRRLSDRELRVVQRRNTPLLRSCAQRQRLGQRVKATILVQIAAGGRVSKVEVDAGGDPEVAGCLRRMVRSWRFPSDLGAQQLVFPVILGGGE